MVCHTIAARGQSESNKCLHSLNGCFSSTVNSCYLCFFCPPMMWGEVDGWWGTDLSQSDLLNIWSLFIIRLATDSGLCLSLILNTYNLKHTKKSHLIEKTWISKGKTKMKSMCRSWSNASITCFHSSSPSCCGSGSQLCWSWSQLSMGKRQGSPWICHQLMAGPHEHDNYSHTHAWRTCLAKCS